MNRKSGAGESIGRYVRDRLGDKWTVPVIDALSHTPMRFGELWRQLGTAPKVLTGVLRALERDGLIERHESRDGGLQVEYTLSTTGRAFDDLIAGIDGWAARYEPRIVAARQAYAPPASRSAPVDAAVPAASAGIAPSHICIPVRGIDETMREFADVFGIEPSRVGEGVTVLQAGRGRERVRCCWLTFPNLIIELVQQMGANGPYNDFLDVHGLGVAHIGMDTAPEWRVTAARRRHLGNIVTERPDGSLYRADVDLTRDLGTMFEVMSPALWQTANYWMSPSNKSCEADVRDVSGIGIVVENARRAERSYSKLVSITREAPVAHLRLFTHRRTDDAMISTCSQGGMAIDLIQPLRGPLMDYLRQHGPGVHHLALNVGSNVSTTAERLERKGAEALFGSARDGHVRLDFRRNLGLQIDLVGTDPEPGLSRDLPFTCPIERELPEFPGAG